MHCMPPFHVMEMWGFLLVVCPYLATVPLLHWVYLCWKHLPTMRRSFIYFGNLSALSCSHWCQGTPCLSCLEQWIIESLRLEKTSKIIKSNCQPNTTIPTKPRPEVLHLHVFRTPPWMVTPPLLWAACWVCASLLSYVQSQKQKMEICNVFLGQLHASWRWTWES